MRQRLTLAFLLPCLLHAVVGNAQELSGTVDPTIGVGRSLVLMGARGGGHAPVDSVMLRDDGHFSFHAAPSFPVGFYQLVLNDTDRVDLILGPGEPVVHLHFDGTPLQRHIQVLNGPENKRLWRYKAYSREHAAVMEAVTRERRSLQPTAYQRLASLDSIERAALDLKQQRLRTLVAEAPESYFSRVVTTSAALDAQVRNGPGAVASVFDFGDPALLRSSIYDKAVMTYLQSINVISEVQLTNASDSLIRLASKDPDCKAYMVEHLVDLFSTYGPQGTLQHIVDTYLAVHPPAVPMTDALRAKVEGLLAVSIGAIGPDVPLTDTNGAAVPLSQLLKGKRFGVLFFYSSTCDHCHLQMPGVAAIHASYAPRGVQVIGIALDDDRAEFTANRLQRGLTFPCYSEFNGWGSSVAKAYEVKATPTLILLDAERRILSKPVDAAELERDLAARSKDP